MVYVPEVRIPFGWLVVGSGDALSHTHTCGRQEWDIECRELLTGSGCGPARQDQVTVCRTQVLVL